ncbi:MAG: 2-C-methyl-D-erythritol 2,4-cyclodiphosphate synthase [Arcanobacterium sp.]|nr:2-C-methyl-D-erythritol 2,4-cyclodiphosphate synthase [Arcanobacterium sp.]
MDFSLFRTATAVDVHAYAQDATRPLALACLQWPNERGLEGHSDADVAAHAACDALLMASGIGELGTVFGVDRPEWAGASGAALLGETVRLLKEAGWKIANVSIQIIGQKPRFSPRKAEAETAMSAIIGASTSVSATTTDRLGFTGKEEGLAAIASALVYREN